MEATGIDKKQLKNWCGGSRSLPFLLTPAPIAPHASTLAADSAAPLGRGPRPAFLPPRSVGWLPRARALATIDDADRMASSSAQSSTRRLLIVRPTPSARRAGWRAGRRAVRFTNARRRIWKPLLRKQLESQHGPGAAAALGGAGASPVTSPSRHSHHAADDAHLGGAMAAAARAATCVRHH